MSLALTALRLQAIAALKSHPTVAALCPGRVFDSQIGDFDHRQPIPVIIVTTEELHGEGFSANNGGSPFDDACDLVLEIMMCATSEEDGAISVFNPVTDRELEATLNLLEWCSETMLTLGRPHPVSRPTPEGRLLLDAVTRRVKGRTVSRFATDQTGEKLAIHLVTYRVELKGEDQRDAREVLDGPYAGLPDPLRTVCAMTRDGTSERQVCDMLAAACPPPVNKTLKGTTFDPALGVVPLPGALDVAGTYPFPEDA